MRNTIWFAALVAMTAARAAEPSTMTLDFDSVVLGPGACTDASSYLGSFGISFVPVSLGATGEICNVVGSPITPTSGTNVFFGLPPVTNTNVSYELLFATPQPELSFFRAGVAPHTSMPGWNAFAFDAFNNLLSSIVEPSLFPGPGAALFTLNGPGIVRVRVDAFNSAARTYNHPPFDDMVVEVAAVPEPRFLLLLGPAVLWVLFRSLRTSRLQP